MADALVKVWELDAETSRWHMAIDDTVRIFEVTGPNDWERLVRDYPGVGEINQGWELPSQNQGDVSALESVPGQRAMRTEMRRFRVPDWNAVAEDWDGVHLTWGGFLTTEGLVKLAAVLLGTCLGLAVAWKQLGPEGPVAGL
ncbi:MAG: hypothetical protein GY773_31610, partial [Actinomycetia bacterium]|nr:hypothetical protein [Actinomycetes bacterium]